MENKDITEYTQNSLSSNLIAVIHTALDSYPVKIYNGEEKATEYMLGAGITSISSELRKVKENVGKIDNLISGIKQRKEFARSAGKAFKDFATYVGLNKKWKVILAAVNGFMALYGVYSLIQKAFFPEHPVVVVPIKK